jgi:hypothetical protein
MVVCPQGTAQSHWSRIWGRTTINGRPAVLATAQPTFAGELDPAPGWRALFADAAVIEDLLALAARVFV